MKFIKPQDGYKFITEIIKEENMKQKYFLSIAGIAGLGLAIYFVTNFLLSDASATPAGRETPPTKVALDTKPVAAQSVRKAVVSQSVQYPGLIEAFQTANLVFRVSGPLIEINVVPGDKVKKGDVLMQIDPRDFLREVDLAQAQLDALKARFEAMQAGDRKEDILLLQATVDSEKARVDFAREELRRAKQLQSERVISQAEFDTKIREEIVAQMDLRVAQQELAKGQAGARAEELAAMRAEIQAMETKLLSAKDRLQDTSLLAPFGGIVTNRMIENFEMVSVSPTPKEVIGLHDISKLKVRVFLPERELVHRTKSERFEIDLAFANVPGRRFKAELCEVDTKPTETKGMYAVTFCFDVPDDITILPGMVADVYLTDCNQTSEQLVIPAVAVLGNGSGKSFVWTAQKGNNTAVKKEIRRGPLTPSGDYVVLDGLEEGDLVITEGNRFLAEGIKVNIVR